MTHYPIAYQSVTIHLFPIYLELCILQRVFGGVIASKNRIGHAVERTTVGFDLFFEEVLVHKLISL